MAIRKRLRKSGRVVWEVEHRLPDRSRRTRTFSTRRDADVYDRAFKAARDAGTAPVRRTGRVTLESVYPSWLASRIDLREKVRRTYMDYWRLRVEPRFGGWPIQRIGSSDVADWIEEMAKAGLDGSTIRGTVRVLKMVLDYAIDEGLVTGRNAAAKVRTPAPRGRRHNYLCRAEVEQLAAACACEGHVVLILAFTGLRFGELTGLRVEDVDLDARRLYVRRSVSQVGGKLVTTAPKTKAGVRSVPIPERLVPILAERITRPRSAPLITAPRGGLLHRENWVRRANWNAARASIDRPTLRLHDLRHSYASMARAAGADLKLVQRAMGHASISITGDTYADLWDDELDAVANGLDNLAGTWPVDNE